MRKLLAALATVVSVLAFGACTLDRGARKDLPNNSQTLDESNATIILMPDQFPNVAHKCLDTTGIWTTTDRNVWVVYNDKRCGGTVTPFVLDNVPGAQGLVSGGE